MSQFSLVFIGRFPNHDEPVAEALSAAFGQSIEWGRPVVSNAPIVLLEGLAEGQAQAVLASLARVEAAGCKMEVHAAGSQQVEGCSKLRWPTLPLINGRPLESYGGSGVQNPPAAAAPMAQISCPHCGGVFRIALNIIAGNSPGGTRTLQRQSSPAAGSPASGGSLTSSGQYAPASPGSGSALPNPHAQAPAYQAPGVGTSSGFYQLPGSTAQIGPATPPPPQSISGVMTPGSASAQPSSPIQLPPAQALPRARSVTPNPQAQPQPGIAPRPATPDRGQQRPSPQSGQRQISPSVGQPSQGRIPNQTPASGSFLPKRPTSGNFSKPEGLSPGSRGSIDLPPAQSLASGGQPTPGTSASGRATDPSASGSNAATHGGKPATAKSIPGMPEAPNTNEFSELQGPMSLDEFEAHISGIHAPIQDPPAADDKKKPPQPPRRDRRR